VKLLRGTECDILRDGTLDYPDDVRDGLDVVIASIHQRHRLDATATTARLVRALGTPRFTSGITSKPATRDRVKTGHQRAVETG
jgi:histidinol phosphatase-like PHP family hydrolase